LAPPPLATVLPNPGNTADNNMAVPTLIPSFLGLTTFGGGYQFGLTDSTVMYAQLDYARVIFDRPNAGEFDSNGYQISVGVRSNVTEAIELKGAVKFLNAGNVDSTYGDFNPTYIELGASYLFTDELSVYADYENESDSDRYSFGLRYNF